MQTWKITEITKNEQRDLQLFYGRDITCNHSIIESLSLHFWVLLSHLVTMQSTNQIHASEIPRTAVYATVPYSPSSLGRESGTDPRLSM